MPNDPNLKKAASAEAQLPKLWQKHIPNQDSFDLCGFPETEYPWKGFPRHALGLPCHRAACLEITFIHMGTLRFAEDIRRRLSDF